MLVLEKIAMRIMKSGDDDTCGGDFVALKTVCMQLMVATFFLPCNEGVA